MSYRFNNNNFLAVYESPTLGKFTLTLREIREDLWEVDLDCGSKVVIYGVGTVPHEFPHRHTEPTRDRGLRAARTLFTLDPEFVLIEVHDGITRTSTHFGYTNAAVGYNLPMRATQLVSSYPVQYGLTRLEVWDDSDADA